MGNLTGHRSNVFFNSGEKFIYINVWACKGMMILFLPTQLGTLPEVSQRSLQECGKSERTGVSRIRDVNEKGRLLIVL